MATSKEITNLVINKVESQEVYDYMVENNLINDDELYLVQGDSSDLTLTSITETNAGLEQKFWRGTTAEYEAIETKDENTMYIITDELEVARENYMVNDIYDPQGKETDVFAYVDKKIAEAIGVAIGGNY